MAQEESYPLWAGFFRLDEVRIPTRVEMGMDRKCYLVGLPGLKLDGPDVRVLKVICKIILQNAEFCLMQICQGHWSAFCSRVIRQVKS